MTLTDFDDLLDPAPAATPVQPVTIEVTGTPVTVADIQSRLIAHNYSQLSDDDDAAVERAIGAAEVHAGSIMARLGRPLDRDATVDREVLILLSIYELYLRVGHEAGGREYRIKAKDLVIAAYGDYPDSNKPDQSPVDRKSVV